MGYASLGSSNYGSEISLLNLAKQFKKHFYVTIYSSNCIENAIIEGIEYKRSDSIIREDILIVSRYLNVFIDHTILSKKIYLWVHDTTFQPYYNGQPIRDNGAHLFHNIEHKIDGVIVLTEFHKQFVKQIYTIQESKIHVIGNGISIEKFNKDVKKNRNKFIYTSYPERGLDLLLKIFPDIHAEFPETELYIYRGEENFTKQQLDTIAQYPYIHYLGEKPNEFVVQEFLSAGVWLYPTNFVETYCISALEAQMAGCMCITSKRGSLPEIVGNRGVIIEEEYGSPRYIDSVMKSVRVFLKTDLYDNKIKNGREWAKEQTWENMSDKWLKMLNIKVDIPTYVINLKSHGDRWEKCITHLTGAGIKPNRFEGVNGKDLEWGPELQKYFVVQADSYQYIPHNSNSGIFGCAMSHIRVWEKLALFPDYTSWVIMEDDIQLCTDFSSKWNRVYDSIKNDRSWDMIYLGFLFSSTPIFDTNNQVRENIYKLVKSDNRQYCGGTHCYVMRSSGARKLLQIIEKSKIRRAIDWFLIDNYDKITAYLAYPMLCDQNRNIPSTVQGSQQTIRKFCSSYCTVEYQGGLGNQIFQIMTLLAYSIKTGKTPIFQYLDKCPCNKRNTYWNSFFSDIKYMCIDDLDKIMLEKTRVQEPGFDQYFDIPNINGNVSLFGYFQSYKFFNDNKHEIYQMIGLNCMIETVKSKYSSLLGVSNDTKLVSVHFRLGDYKTNPFHPIQTFDYYDTSLKSIMEDGQKYRILYFCEEEDNERVNTDYISRFECKDKFVKVPDTITDVEQMLIMSQCDLAVIANSSFSWWGAYLGKPKKVRYPTVWTRDHNVSDDMIPECWK